MLNWSQEDLARATNLSLMTIRKIEQGYISPRTTTADNIRKTIEDAGLEFIEPDGVRRRIEDIFVFEGENCGMFFLEDMKNTLKHEGGDILIVTPTTEVFAKACGLDKIVELDCLIDLDTTITIKCLLTDEYDPPFSTPRFQFRSISKNYVEPTPFCVYGNKYGVMVPVGDAFTKIIVIEAPGMAMASRQHFHSLWEKILPIGDAENPKRTRSIQKKDT